MKNVGRIIEMGWSISLVNFPCITKLMSVTNSVATFTSISGTWRSLHMNERRLRRQRTNDCISLNLMFESLLVVKRNTSAEKAKYANIIQYFCLDYVIGENATEYGEIATNGWSNCNPLIVSILPWVLETYNTLCSCLYTHTHALCLDYCNAMHHYVPSFYWSKFVMQENDGILVN